MTLDPVTDARVRLAFVGMHPLRRRALEARLGGPSGLLEALVGGGLEVPGEARVAAAIPAEERLGSLGASTLVLDGSTGYPAALADLPDRPDALFARGPMVEGPTVAVVGSRGATTYGISVAEQIGGAFAIAGYPVVSGLARGVDAGAHRGSLRSGGLTIAVFGCGIDRWYPAANRALGEEVLAAGGTCLSEYPPGTPPAPWRFPLRNRIVSGLAVAVVVVEAALAGGALITARTALDQGREVAAVPGDIDRPTSAGTNRLIADGAIPVTSIEDLVEAIDLVTGRARVAPERVDHPLVELLGGGATLDELLVRLGGSIGDVLATVGRWELEGLARLDGDRVMPR